jgi:predicted phosphodiesterase
MKLALIADIHGNTIALDAVLADAATQQPDGYCFIGDLVDGHDPSGVLERIAPLTPAYFTYGNTEAYILTGQGHPGLTVAGIRQNLDRLPVFQQATASWAWSRGWLTATGWLTWVSDLPLEVRLPLPNGQALLCVHASPGYADGPGIGPHTSDEELTTMVTDCGAEVVCVGHTHVQFVRQAGSVTVINPGSVSNPLLPDLRAAYAILEADQHGFNVDLRRVAYDHQAVIAAVQQAQHPAAPFIIDHQLGQKTVEGMMRGAERRKAMIKSQSDD